MMGALGGGGNEAMPDLSNMDPKDLAKLAKQFK